MCRGGLTAVCQEGKVCGAVDKCMDEEELLPLFFLGGGRKKVKRKVCPMHSSFENPNLTPSGNIQQACFFLLGS